MADRTSETQHANFERKLEKGERKAGKWRGTCYLCDGQRSSERAEVKPRATIPIVKVKPKSAPHMYTRWEEPSCSRIEQTLRCYLKGCCSLVLFKSWSLFVINFILHVHVIL